MSIFKSGNPTLSESIFEKNAGLSLGNEGNMTLRGTINKFGFLMLMVIGAASFTWHLYYEEKTSTVTTLIMAGFILGLISAFAISFKPKWSSFLAPAYGIFEGLVLGGISAIVNDAMQKKYPGIVLQAVGLTFGVAIAMFLLYNFKIIKVTEKLRSIIIGATLGIAIFYLLNWILSLFGVHIPFMSLQNGGVIGIGISLFVVAIAALNLLLDFDLIEKGSEAGAPKYMEWYASFGLLVTLVWLYLEILKLLIRLAGDRK